MTVSAATMRRNYQPAPGQDVLHAIEAAGVPTDAVTGAGFADKGWTYVNTSNGLHYINTGTRAVPVWSLVIV